MSEPKPNIKEETSAKKTRSPPKKAKVEQTMPKKKKLKTDADKAVEKAQHLRFGKAELTPDELSRLSKAQKREMYAAHAARSAVHREVDQYEDDKVGTQALSEGEKAAGNVRDISKSRYARKLKKKAKAQGKKDTKTARSSAQEPTAAQDAGASSTGEGGSNWLSRWRQKQDIRQSYYAAARSAVHREVEQYEDENVGVQALSEGEKAAGNVRDISKSRYARKLKKKAKMQGKKGSKTAKSSASEPTAAQDAGASGTGEGGSNWLSRWKQRQEIHKSYYAAARSGTAAQTAGGKAASNGASAARSGVEQAVEKGKTAVSTAVKGLMNAAKSNAHVLVIVGVFLLLILMVMSGFSSCGILFSGGTQVSGQTIYSAEDRDIRGAEQDYKKLEKELDKKIKRTPADHPGYNEYQYHLDPIEHDPWQLTSFLTTLYDDYTRSEVQGKLKETFKKQYKLTTWVEVQTRYMTVWVMTPAGIPVPTQVPYEYRIFHTKLVNRGLEVVIREELNNDQWKRYEIFQDTLGGRPYLFNGGLPPGGSDGSGTPGIDYQVPAEALTDEEFAAIYKEAQKYVGTPYVWGGSTPETGFDCSGYVCWVYNQNGYDVGRTTANGLWNKSQHISEAEAKPGDLVFFKGTYDTPGMSHTGIYLGNGMMVSAGDPIKYANIHSSYWEKHLAGFGRLSK